jgi:transglutaminase-like putative cysteine protease
MRLEIRYLNEFDYSEPAWESHNLLRACPMSNEHQHLVSYQLDVTPLSQVYSYTDYWGTRVDEFGVLEPHQTLRICAESVVENQAPSMPLDNPALETLIPARSELSSYLRPSPHATWDEVINDTARDAIQGSDGIFDAVVAISDAVTTSLEYEPGATYVGVEVSDVLSQGKGVCQDFAHLGIAMCRSVGIPARYVSGDLYAADQTMAVTPDEAELDVQTHAWIETFVPGHGWWALDPTNPQPIGELHVKIGHGRDYQDVMPLRGVYHGGAEHELGVHVRITRERLSQATQQQ